MYGWRECPRCKGSGVFLAADKLTRSGNQTPCFYSILDQKKQDKDEYEKQLRQSPNVVLLKDFRGGK